MSNKASIDRARRIRDEQKALVAALPDVELYGQLRRKVMDVFTHQAEPSTMSVPVNLRS